jgi:wyosine [tRNA(Phe)-imidazoG37] synthetase (radical SAM superfamily)
MKRKPFFDPTELVKETREKINKLNDPDNAIDYITIVSDGEPTLDAQLGTLVRRLKSLGFPVAVITNASLLWNKTVRENLAFADYVSLKIDAISESIWKKINRPMSGLLLDEILIGILEFANMYRGRLVSESMFIHQANDHADEVEKIGEFLALVQPNMAYIAVPTRPPTVPTVRAADIETLTRIYHIYVSKGLNTEYLIGYEGNAFAATGSAKDDLLSITAVHPMRQEAVESLLQKTNAEWQIVIDLLAEKQLAKIEYDNHIYFVRQVKNRVRQQN